MDVWTLPACPSCRGKGEVVMVGRSWISIRCDDCRGTGVVHPELPPVAAAVIAHEGRFLLIQRADPEGDLMWQFPSGEIEGEETPEEAAAREAKEGAGLTVSAVERLGERVHPDTGRTMIYVACAVHAGHAHAAAPSEVAAVRWCLLDETAEFLPGGLYPPVRRFLDDP